MNLYFEVIIGVQLLVIVVITIWVYKSTSKKNYYEKKYSSIIDIGAEIEKLNKSKEKINNEIQGLRLSYKEKKLVFDKLVREAAIYDEEIELAELGFYKPHFDFDVSEKYKEQITLAKSKQKQMISDELAIYCTTKWSVSGSKAIRSNYD